MNSNGKSEMFKQNLTGACLHFIIRLSFTAANILHQVRRNFYAISHLIQRKFDLRKSFRVTRTRSKLQLVYDFCQTIVTI